MKNSFLRNSVHLAVQSLPQVRIAFWQRFYDLCAWVTKNENLIFMNYGFAYLDNSDPHGLQNRSPYDRYCAQLYAHIASPVEMKGQDVLEVGSGRGGGASYLSQSRQVKSYTGLDLSSRAVDWCNQHLGSNRLSFRQGSCEQMPFEDRSFDVVLNVESSHCYPDFQRFLGEVDRVLKPGGHFIWTDFIDGDTENILQKKFNRPGWQVVHQEDISKNVVKSLDLTTQDREKIVAKGPRFIQSAFADFAGVQDRQAYRDFASGRSRYLVFVFQKPSSKIT